MELVQFVENQANTDEDIIPPSLAPAMVHMAQLEWLGQAFNVGLISLAKLMELLVPPFLKISRSICIANQNYHAASIAAGEEADAAGSDDAINFDFRNTLVASWIRAFQDILTGKEELDCEGVPRHIPIVSEEQRVEVRAIGRGWR